MTSAPKTSPWGKPQTCTLIAPGIWSVTTASHGGLKLDTVRNAKMPAEARRRGGWYEEDCEWALAVLVHPDAFIDSQFARQRAEAIAKHWLPDAYTAITGKPVSLEESPVLQRRKFDQENFTNFVVRAAVGHWAQGVPKGMIRAWARRASTGEEASFLVPEAEYAARKFDFVIDEARHTREAQ